MGLDFQPVAVHAHRHSNTFLPVHVIAALDDVDDLPVVGNCDSTSCIHRARHIFLVDHPAGHADDSPAVDRGHLGTRQTDQCGSDLITRGPLCLFDRTRDRLGGSTQIDHYPFTDPLRWLDANPQYPDLAG